MNHPTPTEKQTKKRKQPREDHAPPQPSPDHMDPTEAATTFDAAADICSQLMHRYAASSATQHRHLIATAAAMKSILLEDSLPLSPLSYFAASITALSQPRNDAASAAALATLLSIALPIVPEGSISPEKAAEAVGILVRVLEEEKDGLVGSTSSARCVIKCLGVLVGFFDLGDWDSVKLPFETLLKWSVDKRPKVRKCALVYLENALKKIQSGTVLKKASKLILSLLESYTSLEVKGSLRNADGSKRKRQSEPENSDVAHVLSVIRVALPYLSGKITVNVVLKLVELLDGRFPALTRIILNAIEAFLDKVEIEVVTQVAGDIITALTLYVSSKENPKDSVISAANLLKSALDKNLAGDADKWNKSLSQTVNAIAGLLTHEDDVASQASNILKNLIHHQYFGIESEPVTDVVTNDTESNPIASMCSIFMNLLDACTGILNEHTLGVISVLFLKLGGNSFFYMKNIVLKLAEIYIHADGDNSNTHHLQKCFGCAVVAMGAENVLSLVPISFSIENLTCSNTWLLPILNKYIFGASIGYFMEHIVPIAESIKRASRKVKKSVIGQDLQALARGIWGLLPAFCRHPTDISQSFQSFAKLVLIRLEKDSSMHEDIALALQELVKQNKSSPKSDEASIEPTKHSSDLLEDNLLEKRRLCSFSKKEANRNLKALSSYSHELLQALMNVFLVSPPEKRSSLKKAISCLASISNPSVTKHIFISSLERFPLPKALTESGEYDLLNASANHTSCDSSSATDDSQWCLILDLASSVVDGADDDLVGLIFRLLKHALQAEDGIGVREAYFALSCVLEEHPQFCSSKLDELVVLLIGLEPPDDVASLSNRLSSLHTLLVHALKSNLDVENKKPFLILNEIILMVKDSKEEARKTAYDILLRISSSLGGSCATNPDGPYYKLISMILGYLSGPSPHITSAAISSLSVLVFKNPDLCLTVPDVVPSVASLLQTKAVEVIKAVLGFIKVLVSCVQPEDLQNFISVIVDGIIPWSSVSRHHFKSKVIVILEIMIRKCGFPAIKLVTPERYQTFVKKVSMSRHGKTSSKEADSTDEKPDASINGQKKRVRKETHNEENGSMLHRNKRRKQNQESRSQVGARNSAGGVTKKTNHSTRAKSITFDGPGRLKTTNRERFGQASGKPGKRGGAFGKPRKGFGGKNSRKE